MEPPGATNAYCKYNSQILELVISCLYLAALVAAIGSEVIARRYGRRVCTHYPLILGEWGLKST